MFKHDLLCFHAKYEGKSVNKSQKAIKKILSEIFT
jgi:hypothetical protein